MASRSTSVLVVLIGLLAIGLLLPVLLLLTVLLLSVLLLSIGLLTIGLLLLSVGLLRLLPVLLLWILLLSVLRLLLSVLRLLLSVLRLLLPVLLSSVLLLMGHIALGLQDLFEGEEEFRLAGHAVSVLVDDSHGCVGLLLVDAVWAAGQGEDVVEEEVELVGVECARVVAVVSAEDLVNVGLELVVVDHSRIFQVLFIRHQAQTILSTEGLIKYDRVLDDLFIFRDVCEGISEIMDFQQNFIPKFLCFECYSLDYFLNYPCFQIFESILLNTYQFLNRIYYKIRLFVSQIIVLLIYPLFFLSIIQFQYFLTLIFIDFFQNLIISPNITIFFLNPTKNKCEKSLPWAKAALLLWLPSFESNNFILKQLYNMKSPSRQVVNRDIKTSMNLLLRQDNPEKSNSNPSNLRRIICETGQTICRELQVIGWRYKTSLPIIKPLSYQLMQFQEKKPIFPPQAMRTSLNDSPTKSTSSQVDTKILMDFVRGKPQLEQFTVEIVIESIQYRLSDLGCLPFSQIVYLLKEMMIGYDVLLDIFGSFEPTDEMIAVSQASQWRVWMNDDYTINTKPEKSSAIGEKELIYKLIFIAEKHCTPTNLSKVFFSDIKEFTYSKDCSFIKILEKIKQFITANKIFQVNKVTITADKKVNDSIEGQGKKQFNPTSQNSSFTSIKLQKKGVPFNKPKFQTSGFFQFQCKSTSNLMDVSRHNTSMMLSPTHTPSRHLNLNTSAIETNKSPSNIFAPVSQQNHLPFLSTRLIRSNHEKPNYKSKEGKDLNESLHLDVPQRKMNYFPNMKPFSPQPVANRHPATVSKSRLELKALINPKKSASPPAQPIAEPIPDEKRPQKKAPRKYSQQIVKVRSLQALNSKKFAGSNIYMNDPEAKIPVNVIKPPQAKPSNQHSGNYSIDHDKKLLNPNYSSPSTKELKDSKESHRESRNRGEDKYLSMKMNDLGCKQLRNNMSSYYGMGGTKPEQKANKNMAVSYSFQNNNDDGKSAEQEKNDNNRAGNNWTKKLSGLFSDDASIKHLKGSVKFKTAEDEIFQKEYLKDVKLEMLEKFGRPVRHSIVDQQDDFDCPQVKNPYKSMQLIEQVFEDGKSHIEKQEEEEEIAAPIRRRNQTVQIMACTQKQINPIDIGQKQCISEYCQSERFSEEGGFNFQTENYVINPRR